MSIEIRTVLFSDDVLVIEYADPTADVRHGIVRNHTVAIPSDGDLASRVTAAQDLLAALAQTALDRLDDPAFDPAAVSDENPDGLAALPLGWWDNGAADAER